MVSYVICTSIALVLGIVMSTIILGLIMGTKLYRRITMRITRNVLLSDDYNSIIKEFVEKSNKLAMEAATEVAELNSSGDEA